MKYLIDSENIPEAQKYYEVHIPLYKDVKGSKPVKI